MSYRYYILLLAIGVLEEDGKYYVAREEDRTLCPANDVNVVSPTTIGINIGGTLEAIAKTAISVSDDLKFVFNSIFNEFGYVNKYNVDIGENAVTFDVVGSGILKEQNIVFDVRMFRFYNGDHSKFASIIGFDNKLFYMNNGLDISEYFLIDTACRILEDKINSDIDELRKEPKCKTCNFCNILNNLLNKYKDDCAMNPLIRMCTFNPLVSDMLRFVIKRLSENKEKLNSIGISVNKTDGVKDRIGATVRLNGEEEGVYLYNNGYHLSTSKSYTVFIQDIINSVDDISWFDNVDKQFIWRYLTSVKPVYYVGLSRTSTLRYEVNNDVISFTINNKNFTLSKEEGDNYHLAFPLFYKILWDARKCLRKEMIESVPCYGDISRIRSESEYSTANFGNVMQNTLYSKVKEYGDYTSLEGDDLLLDIVRLMTFCNPSGVSGLITLIDSLIK